MEMNEPYPLEITKTINVFVDCIEKTLLESGIPRAERTSVCAEVETQIYAMIERRMEAGAELNLELVSGIIESMDQPESYAREVAPLISPESTAPPLTPPSNRNSVEKQPFLKSVRKIMTWPARTNPGLDWVAIAGIVASAVGVLLIIEGIGRRSEFTTVCGFLSVFAGVVASGVSFWRIRHSNGLLTGQRIASVGVLMLPIVFLNAVLCSILFATPIGRVLGAVILATALVYANYRLIKHALQWLDSYSATAVRETTSVPAEPSRPSESDGGQLPGGVASA